MMGYLREIESVTTCNIVVPSRTGLSECNIEAFCEVAHKPLMSAQLLMLLCHLVNELY